MPEDDTPQETFISTTAGGDGLEFDKRLGSIFDEILSIKHGVKEETVNQTKNVIPGICLKEDSVLTSEDV